MAGRKLKLTRALQTAICKAIKAGNYNAVAAEFVGIGQSTFYRWLQLGAQSKSGQYREFWEAVKKAEAEAEVAHTATIVSASAKNWQAAAWWLERKSPQRWGKQDRAPIDDDELNREIERELARVAGIAQTNDAGEPALSPASNGRH